ncbi:MAG: tRNA epoxyqueuosine(34) reductase QueG [Candidatus Thermoplasmatota archaeon]|nr:tRNA epoxyqueuosine(34) reductase QueG [Candidatus Thermoplasmatota archaeon]
MSYLSREERLQKNNDTSLLEQGSRSIIVFLLNYRRRNESRHGYGRVATYAGFPDYHIFFPRIIDEFMVDNGMFVRDYRSYVDTGPVLERNIASSSNLGWIGKNSMLISPSVGSFTFIGSAVTDLPVDSSLFPTPDSCGNCTRCIDSCPTGAISMNRTVDSNLCISYHTIENRGIIPRNVTDRMGEMIFGCDICNDVCPWNRDKMESTLHEVSESSFFNRMKLEEIAFIDKESFDRTYRGSAIKRATFGGFARNAIIALHNAGEESLLKEVTKQFTDVRMDQAISLLSGHV